MAKRGHDEIERFVGKPPEDRKPSLVKTIDNVQSGLEEKRRAAESRKKQKNQIEKKPTPMSQDKMDDFVLHAFGSFQELSLRDIKRMTGQSDTIIRNALRRFGRVSKSYPTHIYVLKDEFTIKKVKEKEEVIEEKEIEFE
jgi:hypothetical protein